MNSSIAFNDRKQVTDANVTNICSSLLLCNRGSILGVGDPVGAILLLSYHFAVYAYMVFIYKTTVSFAVAVAVACARPSLARGQRTASHRAIIRTAVHAA